LCLATIRQIEEEEEQVGVMNCYAVLGLDEGTSLDRVRERYRELCQAEHPSRGGSEEMFSLLNRAYRLISCPQHEQNHGEELCVRERPKLQTPQPSLRPLSITDREIEEMQLIDALKLCSDAFEAHPVYQTIGPPLKFAVSQLQQADQTDDEERKKRYIENACSFMDPGGLLDNGFKDEYAVLSDILDAITTRNASARTPVMVPVRMVKVYVAKVRKLKAEARREQESRKQRDAGEARRRAQRRRNRQGAIQVQCVPFDDVACAERPFVFEQADKELTVTIPVPPLTTTQQVNVTILQEWFSVCVPGHPLQPSIIDGAFFKPVDPGASSWVLHNENGTANVVVSCEKQQPGMWNALLQDDSDWD